MRNVKKVLAIFLAVLFVLPGLGVGLTASAEGAVMFTVVPNVTTAHPGDTITYSVYMDPVTDLDGLQLKLGLPDGLTFGQADTNTNLLEAMRAECPEFGISFYESSLTLFIFTISTSEHFTSTENDVLLTFTCTVDDDAAGEKTIDLPTHVITSRAVGGSIPTEYDSTDSVVTVKPAAPIKTINLVSGKADYIKGAQTSNVWFGNYKQSGNKTDGWSVDPIKWRVLSNADGKLFLLSDQNLDACVYYERYFTVTWETSTIRAWLNGTGEFSEENFKDSAFSSGEDAAVCVTDVSNPDSVFDDRTVPGGSDTADKVFLLSRDEAMNSAYGFTNDIEPTDSRVSINTAYTGSGGSNYGWTSAGGSADYWWLRSPGSADDRAAIVFETGQLNPGGYDVPNRSIAVRPAVNVDLGKVLFTSAAENGKQGDGLTAVRDYTGSDWKLTLLDDSRSFAVTANASSVGSGSVTNGYNTGSVTNGTDAQPQTAVKAQPGNNVTLTYSGAAVGENEYISAILTDETGVALYYGRLAQPTAADGTVTVTIPADLASGEYTLKLFSEQYNGDKMTDYASAPVDVTLTVSGLFTGKGTKDAPYEIASDEDWQTLSQFVADGGETGGLFFRQTADVNASTYVGTEANPFTGTYDGGGKTLTAALDAPSAFIAPFSYISGATIENLRVDGTVSGDLHSAGLVGAIKGTGNLIRNCVVAVAITAKGDYCGGFVGHGSSSETMIEGCVFTGSITGRGACNAGVFWGRSESDAKITIRNCLENGTAYSSFNFNPVGMGYAAEKVIDNVGYRTAQNGSPNRNWDNAGTKLYAIERGENVSLVFGEATTFYDVSGIGVYDSGLMLCGADAFAPANSTVTLTASYTGAVPDGYNLTLSASAGTLADGTLTMPAQDVTISASLARSSKSIVLAEDGKAPNLFGAQTSNVWFGNYMQSSADSKEPVKWRVLENKDVKLFLLADQNLDVVRYNEEDATVTWETCTLRKWLNGYENHPYDDTFIDNAFTKKELTAVADSKLENANNTTDKVFLLSIAETTNTDYGFTNDTRPSTNTAYVAAGGHTGSTWMEDVGKAGMWWLRSPGYLSCSAAGVNSDGSVGYNGIGVIRDYVGVRPAFNLNLKSVLFTSAAEGGKQGNGLTAVGNYTGSDWKLTLLDESRSGFTAKCTKIENGVYTVQYSGATTGDNEKISAMVVDADGVVTYYGVLENAKAGENTVTVNVNGKLQSGDKLYVFNEQVNGDKKTDYASALVDVTEKALTKYDLWVGGVQFDENNLEINANDIPGVTGSATYDPENNKLTLDGFQYTGEGYRYLVDPGTQNEHLNTAGIYYDGTDDLTVRLVQENAVTVTGDATSSDAFCSENLRTAVTFTGTGSLTARGADNAQDVSSGITVSGSLCVEKQATVTGVGGDSSDSSSYGVLAYVPNTKLEVYGKLTGNGGSASSRSCGVYGMEITVGTDAVLTAAGSAAGNTSEGIVAASVTVRSGTVEAASGKGERYSLAFKAKTGDDIAFDLSDDLTMQAGESKDENEIVTGDGWKNQKYVLIGEPATFSVTVTAGEGMTKTEDSGDASQTVEAGSAMTDVVYTANDGYYFPEDYATEPVNDVSVTRDSFTQITVSGTPTADVTLTLPAATAKGAPDMTVSAESVDVGEDAVITATLPADATGSVTFTIMEIREGGNVEAKKIENVPLEDAVAKASTAALPAGKYQVIADYSGDYKYTAATEQGDFVIRSRDGSITIALDKTKINVGESAVLSVVIPTDAGVIPGSGGNVTVKLNGTELQTITAENGKGNFTISSLHAGVYEVSAVFNGDGLYGAATSNLVQLVVVGTTELALEVWPGSEIEYGEPIIITATLSGDGDPVFAADDHVPVDDNDAALGGVTITVDGKTYYTVPANPGDPAITIDGNVARIQLPAPDAGLHYTVEANYRGDATHPAAKAEAGFTVRKSRTHIEVEYTESILAGETQTIKIILNSPLATGNVTVTLNGTQTNLELKNGSAFFETPPLPAGNYDLEVTYPANDNFEGAGKSVSFEVVSRDSGMTAALTDAAGTPLEDSTVAYGETAYVLATLPDDATGAVTFSLDGNTVEPTDDNPLLCALAGLSTGDHSVKVDFAGDDRYNKATVTVTFTVVCDHVWNEPEWSWNDDDLSNGILEVGYASTCRKCSEGKASGTAAVTKGAYVAATLEDDAYTPYTAQVMLGTQTFKSEHRVYEPGTMLAARKAAFEAHKTLQKNAADAMAKAGDSDEAAALIENAKKAIDAVTYDETKSLDENKAAVDAAANLTQLDKDLADQRAADAVEDKIDAIGKVEYTDESRQKIDDAREAYNDLTDEQKTLVDNVKTLTDAEDAYELLDNKAKFDDYKEAQKKAADDKKQDGDSAECRQLIEDAKTVIDNVTYDETKSLEDNKKAIDAAANLAQLDADLAEHRAIHYAEFYADGTLVESVPYTIDTKSITEPAVPEKVGHTGAWPAYTLKAGGTRIDAVYTPNPQTVTFDANGGKGEMESVNTTWGSKVTLPECTFTAPNGKEFDTWDAGAPGDEIEVKSDLTVKAIWKEKPLTITADVDPTQTGERIKITVPYARRGGIAATLTASEEGVYYESSKPDVISVDENGVIRLEKLCLFCKTATITAYSADGQKVASCVVNVRHAWWQYIIWLLLGSFWF